MTNDKKLPITWMATFHTRLNIESVQLFISFYYFYQLLDYTFRCSQRRQLQAKKTLIRSWMFLWLLSFSDFLDTAAADKLIIPPQSLSLSLSTIREDDVLTILLESWKVGRSLIIIDRWFFFVSLWLEEKSQNVYDNGPSRDQHYKTVLLLFFFIYEPTAASFIFYFWSFQTNIITSFITN